MLRYVFLLNILIFLIFPNNLIAGEQITKEQFYKLRQQIISGNAGVVEVKEALLYPNKQELTNLMHSLFAMKWHRGVHGLLDKLWELDSESLPNLNWDLFSEPPVRIALASTINRIKANLGGTEYRNYIRKFKYDSNSFIRAQSIVALGLNQNPNDIPYLVEMAESSDDYLIQVSISALAFMSHNQARDALKTLAKKYYNTPRGELIEDVLLKAYNISISKTPSSSD